MIHDFCVLPACQGKGFGREILSQTVRLLLGKKLPRIRLSVITQNQNALSLYQKAGFAITAEFHYYVSSLNGI
ncbi:hypothetical protein J1TS5_48640 [Paenibacillus macerans]|uniref:GNAT family N-acetyltransferase n=1 Tax=Paenibacillus macerans TaxID=44252 RepID=UPI001B2762D2|nr:GNAT family N-acetyltransferase [Paenibacillus macerans]GIP12694.1 hypothetical protein J1TS5_48640 [Paenibacillus macerans]